MDETTNEMAGEGVKILHTSDKKDQSLVMKVRIPRGTASFVAENLRVAHNIASKDHGHDWDSTKGQEQRELVEDLFYQRRILNKATRAVLERKLSEAMVTGVVSRPIEPDVRRDYENRVTASEVMDEVENILGPIEDQNAKNDKATTREYNDWLYPLEVGTAHRIGKIGGEVRMHEQRRKEINVPVSELVKAGRNLIGKLADESSRG